MEEATDRNQKYDASGGRSRPGELRERFFIEKGMNYTEKKALNRTGGLPSGKTRESDHRGRKCNTRRCVGADWRHPTKKPIPWENGPGLGSA